MKKYIRIFIALIVAACSAIGAQAQFRYGPILGASLTDLSFKQDIVTVKQAPGMQVGVQTEMMFPGIGFGIDFGLLYNMGGAKVNLGERLMWSSQGYGNERITLHEIVLPFHLRFKFSRLGGVEDIIAPFLYIGPDFRIQAAHSKCDAMKFSGGDVAFSFGAGVELFHNWQLSGQYTFGATYALKATQLTNYSARGKQWTLRLAYLF